MMLFIPGLDCKAYLAYPEQILAVVEVCSV